MNDLLRGCSLEKRHEGGRMGKGPSKEVLKSKSDWNIITQAGLSPLSQGELSATYRVTHRPLGALSQQQF